MRHRRVAALIGIAVALGASAQAEARRPVAIPVTIEGGQGTAIGAHPMVRVRVGRSKPVPLLIDTGSTGLRIFAPAVDTSPGAGVTVTSQPNTITYAGGHRYTGVVAKAVIKIGRQATATEVPFSLVRRASCAPAKPACPAAGGIADLIAHGDYGVLGVGTSAGGAVINPLLEMPGRLGRTWSVHLNGQAGTLLLGPSAPKPRRVAAKLQLRSQGSVGPHKLWADARAPVCLAVGFARACVPGLFDSGTFQLQVWGDPLDTVATRPGTTQVLPGTPVAASVNGAAAPFWSFKAGTTKSKDTVTVHQGQPFVNFGVQAFYTFRITYDVRDGTLTLSRRR
jgi:hypothetical protein